MLLVVLIIFFYAFTGSEVILICEWAKYYAAAGMSSAVCINYLLAFSSRVSVE